MINVLFVGDIVGASGRRALKEVLPQLKNKYKPKFIIVNGENAANGRGITKKIADEFFELGVHAITMGNHTWDQKDIFDFIDDEKRLIRPANYPPGTPGLGMTTIQVDQHTLTVINLQGRTFLPTIDCPFRTIDQLLEKVKTKCVLVDFHAEATSEKISLGWYLDGRVSAVVGTHTHVQTHDETVLDKGTAYVTDVGMVGPRDGVLGMEKEPVLQKFKTQLPVRFTVSEGKWHFHAVCIEIDEQTGSAKSIKLIRMQEDQFLMD